MAVTNYCKKCKKYTRQSRDSEHICFDCDTHNPIKYIHLEVTLLSKKDIDKLNNYYWKLLKKEVLK